MSRLAPKTVADLAQYVEEYLCYNATFVANMRTDCHIDVSDQRTAPSQNGSQEPRSLKRSKAPRASSRKSSVSGSSRFYATAVINATKRAEKARVLLDLAQSVVKNQQAAHTMRVISFFALIPFFLFCLMLVLVVYLSS